MYKFLVDQAKEVMFPMNAKGKKWIYLKDDDKFVPATAVVPPIEHGCTGLPAVA